MTTSKIDMLYVYTDGAAKGNPGPAGIGVLLADEAGETVEECAEYIGKATNNVAEYKALMRGLELVAKYQPEELHIRSDSELMVRQILGIYKVKNPGLQPLFKQVKLQLGQFPKWEIKHVPRNENSLADGLANQGIKKHNMISGV
jgi:ribonuclease HI